MERICKDESSVEICNLRRQATPHLPIVNTATWQPAAVYFGLAQSDLATISTIKGLLTVITGCSFLTWRVTNVDPEAPPALICYANISTQSSNEGYSRAAARIPDRPWQRMQTLRGHDHFEPDSS